MNREIEFRGIPIKGGDFVYGSLIINPEREFPLIGFMDHDSGNGIDIPAHDFWNEVEVKPETVGQYSGVNDDYNNKIYEGDVITCRASEEPLEIKFENGIIGPEGEPFDNYTYMEEVK